MTAAGLKVEQEVPFTVYFDGEPIGTGRADIVVEDVVVLEVKATLLWESFFEKQLIGYLSASDFEVGMVLHFGLRPTIKRVILSNSRKGEGRQR